MSNTIQNVYQNEIRTMEMTLYDQSHATFTPSAAFYQVVDNDGTEVLAEATATVSANVIQGIINTTVTATVGSYVIIWRIVQSGSTYYHKTLLDVLTLLPE